MWHRFLAAGVSATLAIMIFGVLAFADTPRTNVAMQGQATTVPNSRTAQIRLVMKSGDARGWLLDMTIGMQRSRGEGERERENERSRIYATSNVKGSFSLGSQQTRLSTGTVTGWLNTDGTGDVSLSDGNSSTFLEMSFSIERNGVVNATVQGQWPALAVSPGTGPVISAPATPAPTTPASRASSLPVPLQQPANHFYWYLSRTSAMAAFILLFINVCLGIGLKSRYFDRLFGRWRAFDLHQFTALLGGALVTLHIFSLRGDAYFNFSIGELLVPMASPYRPFWTALGIIGFYAVAVVALSCYIRRRIGDKTWRVLHGTAFILFFVILFHSIKAGTDSSASWVQWLYVSTGTITAFLFFWRVFSYRAGDAPQPRYARDPATEESMRKVKPAFGSR